jgi:hypothetical protein
MGAAKARVDAEHPPDFPGTGPVAQAQGFW